MSLRSIGFPGPPLSRLSRRTILLLLAASVAGAVAAGGPSRPSPSVSFPGPVDPGGGVPPDVQGAAGPDHLLAMLNTTFVAQRKSDGAVVRTWTPAEFWSPVSGGDLLFDPRVLWDSGAGRWVAVIATEGIAAAPAILLAVSETADPTAGWTFRKLPVGGQNDAEFPLLGGNAQWIVVTSNLVSRTTGYLTGTAIWAIDKAALLEGNLIATRFTLDSPGSPIAPAVTLDPDAPDEVLLQQADGNDFGHGRIRLYRISDAGAGPSLAPSVLLSVGATWGDLPSPLESLPQAGTTRRIVSDQDEFSSVCVRHGKTWAVQTATISASAEAPAHTVVQWWRIGEDGRVEGFGRIGDPAGKTWLGFPSVSVDSEDRVLIGYSLFSEDRFASAGYSLRTGCGGDASLATIHMLKNGAAPYERLDGAGHNRWGDLSQTVADPDGAHLWTLQEFAAPPVDGESRWGTWWGGFAAATGSRGGACVSPADRNPPVLVRPGPDAR